MHALTLNEGKLQFTRSAPEPVAPEGEVVVQVIQSGICETDLQLIRGYMGFDGILGHEFVGIPESGPWAGKRVVGEINCSCYDCPTCRAGRPRHCPQRTVVGILNRHGAFAERLSIPVCNLHPVPEEVDTDEAVFTEPLAAAFRITEQVELDGSQRVIVLGDGRLGSLCAQVIAQRVGELTVIGKHPAKLSHLERIGLRTMLLADAAQSAPADLVVDCTGNASGLKTSLELVRPEGTVVQKTTVAAEHQLSMAPVVINEIRLIGSRCGPFAPALEALANHSIDVRWMISERFGLQDGLRAFERAGDPDTLKILLTPDSPR